MALYIVFSVHSPRFNAEMEKANLASLNDVLIYSSITRQNSFQLEATYYKHYQQPMSDTSTLKMYR
jgi:hypothetical protein